MGHYYIISSNAGVPATGGSSFVRQCFAYLATCDLLFFVICAGALILIGELVEFIIKLKED